MATTLEMDLPYPEPTSQGDVPYWMQQLAESVEARIAESQKVYTSASGFPAVAASVTAETVIDRIVVPAADFDRVVLVTGNAYVTGTQADMVADYVLYSGAAPIGRCRVTIENASAGLSQVLTANGRVSVPAGVSTTIEARVSRYSGTGTISTSTSSNFTVTNVLAVRA